MDITKRAVKAALGFKKDSELARFFGIGRGGVHHWKDDEAIPPLRQYQLRDKRPDLFVDEPPSGDSQARAA
jgi:hypothetical protein